MSETIDGSDLLDQLRSRYSPWRYRQIYCNRDLVPDRVRWIGFDMDYTLAIYRRNPLDEVVHGLTVQRLTESGYPAAALNIPFDPDFAIRGLVVDKSNGNILKMDAHYFVGKGLHGTRPLEKKELEEYRRHPPHFGRKRFALVDTLFELPESYLFASMVDVLETSGVPCDYERLALDVRTTIDTIHADNSLKSQVMADPERFLFRDPELGATLERFRSAGKKLFLMTNSWGQYTDAVMSFLLGSGRDGEKNWRDYFDIVITAASKPNFFRGNEPFHILDDNYQPNGSTREDLRPGVLYHGGNLNDFERNIGLSGDEVLYIGDHIYGDILRSKRDSAWRTAMIIPEIETELRVRHRVRDTIREWNELEHELRQVADQLSFDTDLLERLRTTGEIVLRSDDPMASAAHASSLLQNDLARLTDRYHHLVSRCRTYEKQVDANFHPVWGSLMKEGNEHSIFGSQVESYACLYTSRVSNFLAYAPTHYFRSPPDMMPHEID